MPDSVSPTSLVSRDAGVCFLLTPSPSTEPQARQGLPHWLLLPLCSCSRWGLVWGRFGLVCSGLRLCRVEAVGREGCSHAPAVSMALCKKKCDYHSAQHYR